MHRQHHCLGAIGDDASRWMRPPRLPEGALAPGAARLLARAHDPPICGVAGGAG